MYLSTLLPLAMALSASASASSLHDEEHPGNSFSLGPAKNNAQITKVTYSLVPPPVPCGAGEKNTSTPPSLALWLGLSDSASNQKTDLFQPLLNWSPDQQSQYVASRSMSLHACCVKGSVLTRRLETAVRLKTSGVLRRAPIVRVSIFQCIIHERIKKSGLTNAAGQVQQPYVPVPQHSEVEFSVTVDDAANKIIQQVSINGKEVSRQADGTYLLTQSGLRRLLTRQTKPSRPHTSTLATNATRTPAAR